MQKITGRFYGILTWLVICVPALGGRAGSPMDIPSWKMDESLLRDQLCETIGSWLNTRNEAQGLKCDQLAESLLAIEKAGARSYFVAAQAAWLRGQPQVAIARLNTAIDKYGNEKAPIGMHVPVRLVGRLWIATIAEYSGDMDTAKKAYETVLTTLSAGGTEGGSMLKGSVTSLCHLHLAEIEMDHLGNQGVGLSHLSAAEAVEDDPNELADWTKAYRNWARYERNGRTQGKAKANNELSSEGAGESLLPLAAAHLLLTGMTTIPLTEAGRQHARRDLIAKAVTKRALESNVSKMHKTLWQYLTARDHEERGRLSEAARDYMELADGDTFFSPVAGIDASRVLKAQGKVAEASGVLNRVSAKYPRFAPLVRESDTDKGEERPK